MDEALDFCQRFWHRQSNLGRPSKTLYKGGEPDITANEPLAALFWQRYDHLPHLLGAEPLSVVIRLVTVLFLCISNANCRSFLLDHPNGERSRKNIAGSLKACLQVLIDSEMEAPKSPLLIVWLFMIGAIATHKLPDQQWFVEGWYWF
jgi:hypothetical protein